MRWGFFLIAFTFAIAHGQTGPPPIKETSPDGKWTFYGSWLADKGYTSGLRNEKSDKVFFADDKPSDNEALPYRIFVRWSPDSRHVAVTFYYGRAVQGVVAYGVTSTKALEIPLHLDTEKTPLEVTLLHPEDVAKFQGYNRLLTGADSWIDNMDLSIDIDMLAFLKDKKSGDKSTLSTSWHKMIRFEGNTCRVVESTCDSYDLTADTN
jgi:hypothetical protein